MIYIVGVILSIIISSLWIFLPLKRVPEEVRLNKGTYIKTILVGATICTLLIIILEVAWDRLTGIKSVNNYNLLQCLAASFLRAALIEETVKYFFARKALKKHQPQGKLQYMLLAGCVGMGYGIIEKLVTGSTFSLVLSTLYAFHILYQFVMGYYLYEADHCEDVTQKRNLMIKAFLVPFVIHGTWDYIQFIAEFLINKNEALAVIGVILCFTAMIVGAIVQFKVIKYLKKS